MRLLRLFVILSLAAFLAVPLGAAAASAPSEPPAPVVRASEARERVTGPIAEAASKVLKADGRFNALGVRWDGPLFAHGLGALQVRLSGDGEQWGEWIDVVEKSDDAPSGSKATYGEMIVTRDAQYVEYRLTPDSGPGADEGTGNLYFTFIDSSQGPTGDEARAAARPGATGQEKAAGVAAPAVIPRSGWGANESYRYNSAGSEIWPPQYRVIEKAFVHHTATSNGDPDAAAAVRAIYYYHAVTLGWGDIGYNFLIDWQGNIYEGRYGGPNVIAGHAIQYNPGSVGIAVLGNFMGIDVPAQALDAMVRTIAWKTEYLDPHGSSFFVDKVLPNILGHRDALTTECPGDFLEARLPEIRDRVAGIIGSAPGAAVQVQSVSFSPTSLAVGGSLRVDVTVTNTGSGTAFTQGPAPGTTYEDWEDYRTKGFPESTGTFRVAVDYSGRSGLDHPYRWGLGDALEPGQSRTITGYIHINSPGVRTYWAGVVQEYTRWWGDNAGATSVVASRPDVRAGSYNTPAPGRRVALPLVYHALHGWGSLFTLQNTSPSVGSFTVTFYSDSGGTASTLSGSLPGMGSTTLDLNAAGSLPSGFAGSAIVTADVDVAAVVNSIAAGSDLTSYEGLASGVPRAYAPLLFKGFNGWSAGLQLQNLATTGNRVLVTFYQRDGNGGPWTQEVLLPPNGPKALDLRQVAGLPEGFVGSAVAASQDGLPLAGVVNVVKDGWKAASAYTTFASGAPTLYAPVLFKAYYGWLSGLQVQNVGSTAADASVSYAQTNGGGGPWVEIASIGPGSTHSFYQPDNAMLPGGFVGAGTVYMSAGQGIGIVNELNYSDDVLLTYNAIQNGATALYAPVVMRVASGWSSGIQVQNLGGASADITLDYYSAGGSHVASQQDSVAPGFSKTYYHMDTAQLPAGFVGSLVVKSRNGQPIAAIVNLKK